MPRYSVGTEMKGAYIIDERQLIEINAIATRFLGSDNALQIKMTLSGSQGIEGDSIAELLMDKLLHIHTIEQITFQGVSATGSRPNFYIIMEGSSFFPTQIIAELAGDHHQSCREAKSALEELINGSRQWYSMCLSGSSLFFFFAFFVLGSVSFQLLYLHQRWDTFIFWSLLFLQTMVGWLILIWVFSYLFPYLLFDVGKSSKIIKRASTCRAVLFGAVALALVVGVLSGVLGNLITNLITQH
jgi:hypothetical protein